MKYLLIFGGSIVHGVGGSRGGWADTVKSTLHERMFGEEGLGEACQVYELGVPGNTLRDLSSRFETELHARVPQNALQDAYVIFTAGTNDSRATNRPSEFLFTPAEFAVIASAFLRQAKGVAKNLMAVGLTPVDESKVSPKENPLTGRKSYFKNSRIEAFEAALSESCQTEQVAFLPLFNHVPANWTSAYLANDGLHPNDKGHRWIFNQVYPKLQSLLGSFDD